jgi:hypothetical protein
MVIVVSMLVVATPSEASKSCMTKTNARDVCRTSYLYWHGADHCWDATPTRHNQIHKVQRENNQQFQQKNDQPKWHDAMSEMLADAAAGAPWVNRWVDIVQVAPPPTIESQPQLMVAPPPIIERRPEPIVRPRDVVVVVLIAITRMLAIVMIYTHRAIA